MYSLIWELFRYLLAVLFAWGFVRLAFVAFDYLEVLQNRAGRKMRLFAVRRRWYHRLTRRG